MVLGFWFQAECLGCRRRSDRSLCTGCGGFSFESTLPGAWTQSALRFQEPWRSVLHAIKYERCGSLLRLFDPVIQIQNFDYIGECVTLIPIPLHLSTYAKRGFNQSEFLAKRLARRGVGRFEPDRLIKQRATPPQSTLGREERKRNLNDSFQWFGRRRPVPEAVLLVDDVLTTGATLDAASAVLLRAGVRRVYRWTLFRASSPPIFRGTSPEPNLPCAYKDALRSGLLESGRSNAWALIGRP